MEINIRLNRLKNIRESGGFTVHFPAWGNPMPCDESHLNNILRKPIHEALRQRITIHYNYKGLDDHEASEYTLHKLNCTGTSRNIISEAALGAIHRYSRGNPRLIDNLMTDSLTIGVQQECQVIDVEIILSAANNQNS